MKTSYWSPDDIDNIYNNIKLEGFINTQNKYSNIPIEVKTSRSLLLHDKLPNIFIKAIHDISNETEYTKVITSSKGYHVLKILESDNTRHHLLLMSIK